MAIKITHYTPFKKEGFCKGILSVYIEEAQLHLRDIREMQKVDGQRWFAYPSKEYINKKGEKKYTTYYGFEKEKNDAFHNRLRLALLDYKVANGLLEEESKPIKEEMPF